MIAAKAARGRRIAAVLGIADDAGVVTVPTLEAGVHVVRAKGDKEGVRFEVPALPSERPAEVKLTLP